MRIVITGNPGTGKSKIAQWLAKKLRYSILPLTSFIRSRKLNIGNEVDVKKLRKALLPLLKKQHSIIIEGHLACEIRLPVDAVIVLRCNPKTLRKRLQARKYSKKKQEENLLAEMIDYATQRAEQNYKAPVLELETSGRTVAQCGKMILKAIKQKKKKLDAVNYTRILLKELRLYDRAG